MKPAAASLLVFAILLAAGCSDVFDPLVESGQVFALYGFLDARQDTQFVRVQPIAELEVDPVVDARVTSTERATGETLVWQDSLVRLDNGAVGTVFFAPFHPQPGGVYRIEAARPDAPGSATVAEVPVPAEPPFRIAAPTVLDGVVTQLLTLESTLRPSNVRVTYTVRRPRSDTPIRFSFDYVPRPAVGGAAFEVLVNLLRNAVAIQSVLDVDPEGTERVELLDLRLSYDLIDERSGTVTGGVGSFGVAAGFVTGWALTPNAVAAIGFVDAQGGG